MLYVQISIIYLISLFDCFKNDGGGFDDDGFDVGHFDANRSGAGHFDGVNYDNVERRSRLIF